MLRVVIGFLVLWALKNVAHGEGICSRPFEEFVQCTKVITDERIEKFIQESSLNVQTKIHSCFATNGCGHLDFRGANLGSLLGPSWAARVNNVMDLLKTTSPDVRDCMTDFLVGFAAGKVETCIRNQHLLGSSRFKMPPLPPFRNVDVATLAKSTVHRIFVGTKAATCSSTQSDHQLRSMMACVREARDDSNEKVCSTVDTCRQQKITPACNMAYDSVRKAACQCFEKELQNTNGSSQNMKDVVTLFIKGRLIDEYKRCSRQHGVPVPTSKLMLAQESIKASVREYVTNGIPNHVRQIGSQIVVQIAGEIQTILCGKCLPQGSLQTVVADAQAVRAMAHAMNAPPTNGGILTTIRGNMNVLLKTFYEPAG